MRCNRRVQAGLTLVEVLVATLVLGTAVSAFLALMGQQAANADALRENILARIAAENAMVEVLLAESRGTREGQGEITVGERTFLWEAVRAPAPLDGIDILTVSVTLDEGERILASLETLRPGEVTP